MTATSGTAMQDIEALLADRQKYESWLGTLESRKSSTPAHVYERVKGDYESRLQEVLDKLLSRSTDVQKEIDKLSANLATLQADESRKRDERYEAELRHAVGEYTPEQWKTLSGDSDAEISRLSKEREDVGAELQKHQELLKSITARRSVAEPAVWQPEPSPPPPAPTPQPIAAPPAAAPTPRVSAPRPRMATPAPEPAPAPASRPAAPPAGSGGGGTFDELEFLKSVIEPRADGGVGLRASGPRPAIPPAPAAPPPPPPPAPVAPPAPASRAPTAPPPPLPPPPSRSASPVGGVPATGIGLPNTTAMPPLPPAPAAPPPPRGTAPGRRMTTSGSAAGADAGAAPPPRPGASPVAPPPAARTSGDGAARRRDSDKLPPFLKDVPSEQVKTLKCQECGTMNYPTEWYCERCGGELAAM